MARASEGGKPHAGADDCADSAAHSPPAAAAIGPPEAETVVVASAGAPCGEANDAGAGVDAAPEPRQLSLNILLPNGEKVEMMTSTLETYNDLKQVVLESPLASNYSCFYLKLDGRRVKYADCISESLKDGSYLEFEEGKYNETEVRIQLNRLREMLGGPFKNSPTDFGLDEGISAFSTLCDRSDFGLRVNKESHEEPNLELRKQNGFASGHSFSIPKLSIYLPPMDRTPVQCLRSLAMSQWHPPPHHRRLAGDIAYLAVTTLEGESVQVTAHVDGFFVNKSTAQLFDPSPRSPLKSTCKAHNIADLLTKISPRFGAQYKLLQETYSKYIISEIFSPQSTSLAIPWLARPPKHTEDSLRAADSYLKFGPEALEAFRDWNDEIQAHRELPRETVHDRLFRERGLIRIYADFAESAGRGAQMVVMGDVQPVNPLDRNDGHMYINGGIFFSRGFDGHEAFQKIGGDAASHVATGKDIEGVRILNNLDIDGLYTLGSAVVDYKGERLVAQTIVPGILRGANVKEKVVYGSFDAETKLAADPTFHEIFGRVAEQLHLAEHEVDAGGNDGSRVELFLSKEAKGLLGGDGRRYALDLYRTCPVDVEWLESECLRKNAGEGHKGDEEVLPPYPHQLVLLRPELVEAFWMYRLRCWTRDQAAAIAEKVAFGRPKG